MSGKPFTLFKKNRIYYVRFRLPDGTRSALKSTGDTTRSRAEAWAINYLHSGQIVLHENVTLAEFSKNFFDWSGPWATDKRVRGLRISRRWCNNLAYLLNSHIVPNLGNLKLVNIQKPILRQFRNSLYNAGYSGNTINKALTALKAILIVAEEQSLIQNVPKIEKAADNPKHKGILTVDEVKRLFSVEWRSEDTHCNPSKDEFRGYAANLLACSTGLRMGEIQALVLSDVHLKDGYIHVRRSWAPQYGLNETTKTGRARNIFIPEAVKTALCKLISVNPLPGPESFLFFADKVPDKPMEPAVFTRSLFRAMRKIGISEQERRERNITFHSWRHWFNSLLINAKVPLQKIQAMTGHLTNEMTQHYYHIDDMSDVVQTIQDTLFEDINKIN
jgi:integrase